MLTIASTTSTRCLHIHRAQPDCLYVALSGEQVTASTSIWLNEDADDAASFSDFFRELGAQQTPWQGERQWQSTEGDFTLTVRCSALGAVYFQVVLKGLQGAPEEWQVTVGIESELGQLARIAAEATQL